MTRFFLPLMCMALLCLSLDGRAAWPAENSSQNSVKAPEVQPNIASAQKQIDEILRINQKLSHFSQTQTAEVERILEQASIHKKILQDMQNTPLKKKYRAEDAEEMLRQEKIRLIQEQTKENKSWIETQSQEKPEGNQG